MARVTVEDCVDKVDNRFELVLLAAQRARAISAGEQITIKRDNDKNPVVALREIAGESVGPEDLREQLIHSMQRHVEVDEPDAEQVPQISAPDEPEPTQMSEEDYLRAMQRDNELRSEAANAERERERAEG